MHGCKYSQMTKRATAVFFWLSCSCDCLIFIDITHSCEWSLFRWDVQNNTWAMSEALRPLVVNFEFQRKGKTAYITTGFAGFVGAFTGFRPVSIWYIIICYLKRRDYSILVLQRFQGWAPLSYVTIRFSYVHFFTLRGKLLLPWTPVSRPLEERLVMTMKEWSEMKHFHNVSSIWPADQGPVWSENVLELWLKTGNAFVCTIMFFRFAGVDNGRTGFALDHLACSKRTR